ncbi:MAG: alpha/beta hydrolase [Sphingobium sp.]|nr:alpha/beta hydrolase [Sphingobium sp.]
MSDFAYNMEGFTRHVAQVNGIEHVWWEIGAGDPCVYFHGGGTFHGFDWARDWAGQFRMILPHHPNFGESADAGFTSIGDYAAHYRAFFVAIGLPRFHLVGASMGGYLASTYAARNQAQIDRLVLVSPAGLRSARAPLPDFANIPLEKQGALFAADPDWIAPFWPAQPSPDWLALRQREGAASFRARGVSDVTYPELLSDLEGLRLPTLLLWGDKDQVLPLPLLEEWRSRLPQAQSIVIPGGGHLLLDEFPAAREAALAFLTA